MTGPPMLADEKRDLETLERVIERGLSAYLAVADAVRVIKADKLYRGDYDSWEAYCAKWDGFVKRKQNEK